MRPSLHVLAPLLAVATLAPAAAHADSFLYTFSDPNFGGTSFTYDSPTLITKNTGFSTPFCILDGGACNGIAVDPASSTIVVADRDASGSGYYNPYFNLPASFFTPGTHFDAPNDATLTITEVAGFRYTFNDPAYNDSFTYTSPTLITSSTGFRASSCVFEGGACNATLINPAGVIEIGEFDKTGSGAYDLIEPLPTSFFLPGDHFNAQNDAYLDITPILPTTVTPEPSSLVLLGSGLLGTVGALRRRLRRA